MSTTIESLQLEITQNSQSAVNGIDALTQSLTKLRSATKGGLGLSSVAKQITSVVNAVNSINTSTINNLSGLAKAIQLLGGVKVSTTIGKSITDISTSLNTLNIGNGANKVQELVTALQPLSEMPKANLSSFITQLRNIPKVMTELNKVDMGAFATKILEVTNAVKPLATEINKIATGFSSIPNKIQQVITSNDKLAKSNKKTTSSFTDVYYAITSVVNISKKIGQTLYGFISKASDYIEDMNLFSVAMGDYAESASEYAQQVSEAMGIDTGEWMRNQGLFQTLITGFGVAGKSASQMSENLTQLAYDLSSFYNIDVETAMQKLKSGMAGELEPLRAIGYDLSQAKLQASATELGIDKAVSSMTQAEKAMIRYHAIMTQVTSTHGDMARTIEEPANQIRILKAQLTMLEREIGNVFMPLLKAVLPYLIAITKVLREIVSAIAALVDYKPPDMKDTGVDELASGSEATTEALEGATEQAKKLKSYMLGFDELNVINPNSDSSGEEFDNSAFDIDLDAYNYDFLGKVSTEKIDAIVEKVKEWFGITKDIDSWSDLFETKLGRILTSVGLVGGALLLWKLSTPFLKSLDTLSVVLGATLLIDSILVTFQEGLSWQSIIEGAIGGALIGAGLGFKFGGWKGAIGGIVIGIGVSLLINGITSMISEGVNIENVITVITGVLTTIGGLVWAVKLFNKNNKLPSTDFNTASETIADVSSGTNTLTTKLKTLVKDLALGLVIIAEVALAAFLIVGAIWVLGKELEQVGKAWEPVIENAGTVAIGMGIGTALLVGIGVATALLGKLGKTTIVDIALGTLILVEMGVATILFTAEIIVIGKLLEEVGEAWKPVLKDGETIATGIGLGTALLVGIGVVAAALGVATVATAGLLPLAIGLGTLMLIELGIAFVAFTDNIIIVAKQLKDDLHPALDGISAILPGLSTDMSNFTDFMGDFAWEIVQYSANSLIAGLASTIGTVIEFFTGDPVKKMSNEIHSQKIQFTTLVDELEDAIPKIKEAVKLQKEYNDAMEDFAKEQTSGFFSGVSGFFQGVGEGIGDFFDGVGSLFSSRSIDTTANVSVIPTYATGGFPDSGQAFIARENGIPEMVGTIGRRTAVANNDQIVESIAVGVADANGEQNTLLREQNSLLRALLEKDTGVYLDGKSLSKSVDKFKNEQGRVIMGGAL